MMSGAKVIAVALTFTAILGCYGEDEMEKLNKLLGYFRFNHVFTSSSQSVCPPDSNTYVSGVRVRFTFNHVFGDAPMVTEVEAICSDGLRSEVSGDQKLMLGKSVGNWSEIKRCPNGQFATEVLFHQYSLSLFVEQIISKVPFKNRELRRRKTKILRSVSQGNYVSGVSLYCAYRGGVEVDTGDGKPGVNYFTLGKDTGYYLKLYCLNDRAVTGLFATTESAVDKWGERSIPVEMSIRCEIIYNPGRHCRIELAWEDVKFSDMECLDNNDGSHLTSSTLPEATQATNITCKINNIIGPTLNGDITNLDNITGAYYPVGLMETAGFVLVPKLLSNDFKMDWTNKYQLSIVDYNRVVKNSTIQNYSTLRLGQSSVVYFAKGNNNLQLMQRSSLERRMMGDDEIMKRELKAFQLVGYCSMYKIYFPMLKSELQKTVQKQMNGISMNIMFKQLV